MSQLIFLIVLCCTIVAASSNGNQVSDELTGLLNKLRNDSPDQRLEAYYRLIEIGNNGDLQGNSSMITAALSSLFAKAPDKADEIKLTLIQLLERENSFIKESEKKFQETGETLSEAYVNYHGDLIDAVSSLKDKRATNALMGCLGSGKMAIDGLVALDRAAVDPVVGQLTSKDYQVRQSATMVLARLIEANKTAVQSDLVAMEKIKRALIQSTQDDSHHTRISAIEGLRSFAQDNDQEVILLLERLSQTDPYAGSQSAGNSIRYPVREAAKKVLQSKTN
jgi:HEAT repeat protein